MDEETVSRPERRKLEPAQEFDKILSKITGMNPESIKQLERVIVTPEGTVKHTYDIQVDSATGKQKVIEKFTTYKKECSICGGAFAKVFKCYFCGAQVCANDSRHRFWSAEPWTIQLCNHCFRQHYPNEFKDASQECQP